MLKIHEPEIKRVRQENQEQVLVLVERKSLTPWGVRTETTWVNALESQESYVRYSALKPISLVRGWLVRQLATYYAEDRLLVRWLLSLLVHPDDAQFALTEVDSCGVPVPLCVQRDTDDESFVNDCLREDQSKIEAGVS